MYNITSLDLSSWDTGNVATMRSMFSLAFRLTSLDVAGWNTSNVTDMNHMFSNVAGLTSLDLSSWDVSSVINMAGMFYGARGLTHLDTSGWNTGSLREMTAMFVRANGLTTLDLSHFDTRNVTHMFSVFGMENLVSLDLSGWDTIGERELNMGPGNTVGMTSMFSFAYSLRHLTLGENFRFNDFFESGRTRNAALPNGYWQNVGLGTVDNPLGEFVFTSEELMRYYDGAIHADTWARQLRVPDEITVTLNGTPIKFDVTPIIENDRILVPFRVIFEALGAEVDWNYETQIAIAELREMTIVLTIGSEIAYVNGQPIELDVSPRIVDNRTLVPLRFVAENFGFDVEWNDVTKTISIN